jgi:hypothetical protein
VCTDIAQNEVNFAKYDTAIVVALPPGIPPVIKVEVLDSDGGKYGPSDDCMGQTSFDLGAMIAGARPGSWATATNDLGGDAKAKGSVTISVRPYCDPIVKVSNAVKLRNADGFFGKSDPYVKLLGLTGGSANWGETTTQRDNLSPVWNESFTIKCLEQNPLGGKLMPFVAQVWDEDDKSRGGPSDDLLGAVELPWKRLWPNEGETAVHTCPLSGKGAKEGSKLVLETSLSPSSVDQGALASAGRNLLAMSISGGAEQAAPVPVKVSKKACKAVLNKGLGFKIADCTDNIADNFSLGLAWDVTNGKAIDLDASCVFLDKSLNPVDTVSFQKLRSSDGSMVHQGDEREGDEEGDDEKLKVCTYFLSVRRCSLNPPPHKHTQTHTHTHTHVGCTVPDDPNLSPPCTNKFQSSSLVNSWIWRK